MPISIVVDAASGVAIGTGTGVLDVEDCRAAVMALWKNSDWAGLALVWDFRTAQLDVSAPDAFELAQFVNGRQPSPPPVRSAIVVSRDVDYGMARMFGTYRERSTTDVRVYRDFDAAIAWTRAAARPAP